MREPNRKLISAAEANGVSVDQLYSFFSDVGDMSEAEALKYIAGIAQATAALNVAREITERIGSFKDVDADTASYIIFASKKRRGRRVPDPVGDLVQRKLDGKQASG